MSSDPRAFTEETELHITPLPDYRILAISGVDAESFLQSQFTQDVNAATTSSARLSAYCSAKGRMLASFVLWQIAGTEPDQGRSYQLMIRSDIADSFVKRLRMFVLRAKVKVEDTGLTPMGYWAGIKRDGDASGLTYPEPWQVVSSEQSLQFGLPALDGIHRGVLIADASLDLPQAQAGSPEQWAVLDILSGIPWVESANQEKFIPQDVNLDAIGAVSFTKGCYPGQEVVARSHYRGKLKRRMLNGYCEGHDITAAPGGDITDRENTREPSGQIVNAASVDNKLYLLFEVRLDAAEHNQLALGDENGPAITLLSIPYPLEKPALA